MGNNTSLAPELPEAEPGSGIRQAIRPTPPTEETAGAFALAEQQLANLAGSDTVEPDRITKDMNTMIAYIIEVDSLNE